MDIKLASITLNNQASAYIPDDGLIKAVEVAIALNKPLLISGEPGTGKTRLAEYIAWQLNQQTASQAIPFLPEPLVFDTKSTSVATDLFYSYDAISHFRNRDEKLGTADFIELKALGKAIALRHGKSKELDGISGTRNFADLPGTPHSSVVLIDEIDKAPRDFPNDLLNEIEHYKFSIKELGKTVPRASNDSRIVVIMTSNSEKNLPNAFLRRCVFYHIDFPRKKKLLEITKSRMALNNGEYKDKIDLAFTEFMNIREKAVYRKPATSEFLEWLCVLRHLGFLDKPFPPQVDPTSQEYKYYEATKSLLIKSSEDREKPATGISANDE
jgi:MoxR-like ATPase